MGLDRDMGPTTKSNTFLFLVYNKGIFYIDSGVKSKLRAYSGPSQNFHSYNSLPRDFSETPRLFKSSMFFMI
ncbi:hypothetical protein VN97_g10234 [Penicillium thymicola]|uniref:Uncharacterized protein n=1 Tax=Penicillium thymicola TaxID=293382 RepID=A0AAI9TA59_PENTH|nr:hypothetical protein VN97_g10234 [Penicillium thymicola]